MLVFLVSNTPRDVAGRWMGNLHIIFNSLVSSLIKVSRETFDSHPHPRLTPPGWSWTCPSWACTAGWGPAVRRGRGRGRAGAARSARAAPSGTQSWSPSVTSSSPSTGGQTPAVRQLGVLLVLTCHVFAEDSPWYCILLFMNYPKKEKVICNDKRWMYQLIAQLLHHK